MKNLIQNTARKILFSSMLTGILFQAHAESDEGMITTSKPHRLPRLMTMQTAEVLESYAIGFAGSGNIHRALSGSEKGFSGAVYAGLGDVAELGYDQEKLEFSGVGSDNRMKGHIKIQPVHESKYIPALAVSYGSSLSRGANYGQNDFDLERQTWMLGLSKSFRIGNYDLSIHPAITAQDDALFSVDNVPVGDQPQHETRTGYQVGVTWQTTDNTMFILENRSAWLLDTDLMESNELSYNYGVQSNIGVRFYLRNWIFMDAGILSQYDTGKESWQNGIHANLTGLIPLKSVAERISGHLN